MLKFGSLVLVATAFVFVACGGGTPKCSDEITKNLVIDIAKDELTSQRNELLIPLFLKFEVDTIRTTKYDKNIDRYECAANFIMTGENDTSTLPITHS